MRCLPSAGSAPDGTQQGAGSGTAAGTWHTCWRQGPGNIFTHCTTMLATEGVFNKRWSQGQNNGGLCSGTPTGVVGVLTARQIFTNCSF